MIESGVLEDPEVDTVIGLHLDNNSGIGTIGVSPGPAFATSSEIEIEILGRGGEPANPQRSSDPVAAAAQIINALPSLVAKNTDPLEPTIISICSVSAGDGKNVIPDRAVLGGTVRCFDTDKLNRTLNRIKSIVDDISKKNKTEYKFFFENGYPPVINDEEVCKKVRKAACEVVGKEQVKPIRISASEDISYFLQRVPGCFFTLGSKNDKRKLNHPHHTPYFDFDEDCLLIGTEVAYRSILYCLEE